VESVFFPLASYTLYQQYPSFPSISIKKVPGLGGTLGKVKQRNA
jgi:hypothetical protein